MSDDLDDVMAELRAEYVAEAPERLAMLTSAIEAFGASGTNGDAVTRLLHQLTGSAGSYGFEAVSELSRELEQWMKGAPPADGPTITRLRAGVETVRGMLLGS